MSETAPVMQPPYLAMAAALRQPDVLDVAELAAMRVASMTIAARGGLLPGEVEPDGGLTADMIGARVGLAKRVLGRQIPQRTLAIGLMQSIAVAMALMGPDGESNPAVAVMSVDLGDAWVKNWTDYALLMAAVG